MRNRLMPAFGRLRLDAIGHARVSAWFDAASVDWPGAANRAFEILRAMLAAARQWVELGEHVPDACANIAKNPRRPIARFLGGEELQRLGAVLDRHAALRSSQPRMARNRRAVAGRRERAPRRFEDRSAHPMVRAGSGGGPRGAAPERRRGAGVS